MKIIVTKDYLEMSKLAAKVVANELEYKNNLVLGLATGQTMIKFYKELLKICKKNKMSFKDVTTFNLDEYVGLSPDDKNSYNMYMYNNLFKYIDINLKNTFIPKIIDNDVKKSIHNFEKEIKKRGPIDLQIIGIGENGHIGFNEPGSKRRSKTRVVKLSENTIKNNAKYFNSLNEVPKLSISMGIETILNSKKIILLASGKNKAKAIFNTVAHKMSTSVPSSFLQKHKNVILIIDEDAAELLEKKDKIN